MKAYFLLISLLLAELLLAINFSWKIYSTLLLQRRIDYAEIEYNLNNERFLSLSEKLVYIKTDFYVEEIARDYLMYSKSGDYVYILPNRAMKTVPLPSIALEKDDRDHSVTGEILDWYRLFFN